MEYVYAAMMLHAAEKDINDDAVTAVLAAAGGNLDDARVKAQVIQLRGLAIAGRL
ncbi:MAG TPA: 50S ribosomal protein P1, partial [Candidatus Poseidoniales archaeon]